MVGIRKESHTQNQRLRKELYRIQLLCPVEKEGNHVVHDCHNIMCLPFPKKVPALDSTRNDMLSDVSGY